MEGGLTTLDGTELPSVNEIISYHNYTIDPENDLPIQHYDSPQNKNYTISSNGSESLRDIAYLILFGSTSVVGLVGNSMVCRVVFRKGGKRNFTNLLLANLAISDCICVLIFFVTLLVCSDYLMSNLGAGACLAIKVIQILSFQVSSVTMTIIAIDRFLLVYQPLVRKHRRVPLHYLMPIVWLISCAAILITSPRYSMFRFFTPDDPNGGFIKCEVKAMFAEHALTPKNIRVRIMVSNTGLFWLPFSIIVVCYSSLAWKVMHRNVGTMTTSQQELLLRRKWKTIKMLIASVAVYGICWVPLMVINVLESLGHLESSREKLCGKKAVLVGMAFWLVYSSSCYNPFVYWIYSKEFRGGLKEAWAAVGKYIHCNAPGYCCYCCCSGVASLENESSLVSPGNSQTTNSMKSSSLDGNVGQS